MTETIDILGKAVPLWLIYTWLTVGVISGVTLCIYHCGMWYRDYGYIRGSDIKDSVIGMTVSTIAGPVLPAFILIAYIWEHEFWNRNFFEKKGK